MQSPLADGSASIAGVQVFGFLLSLGILTGYILLREYVRNSRLSATFCLYLYFMSVPIGLIGSHVFEVLCYHPQKFFDEPGVLLSLNDGISSFGMILTEILWITGIAFVSGRQKQLPALWDALAFGIVGILLYVRMGCALVGDHPGLPSNFFLAGSFPDGRRHDLGYYELLFLFFVLLPLLLALSRRFAAGGIMGVFTILYGAFRIYMDSLRVADARYFGWTPGQYSSLLLIVFGALLLLITQRSADRVHDQVVSHGEVL